jgi:hypothetical protein
VTARLVGSGLRVNEGPVSMRETVMNQQAVRQMARRSALDAPQYGAKNVPTGNADSRGWRSPY